jgi:S1-C subfamily serine protease
MAADPDAFASKSYFAKSQVILAGVAFNFVLAFLIFVGLFWQGVAPLAVNSKFDTQTETLLVPTFERAVELGIFTASGIVLSPISGSPSEIAGVSSGDVVVSINGESITTPGDFVSLVRSASNEGKALQMELSRSGTTVPVTVVPKDGKI